MINSLQIKSSKLFITFILCGLFIFLGRAVAADTDAVSPPATVVQETTKAAVPLEASPVPAESTPGQAVVAQPIEQQHESVVIVAQPQSKPVEQPQQITDSLAAAENVTLEFKDADIRSVLKMISYKSGVNIVATPEVLGNITIRLVDVPWEKALDVVLRTHGFGYDRVGNVVIVAPIEKLTAQKKQEVELAQVQPTVSEVFTLKYLDAQDAKKALDPLISPRGKITVLEMTGQAGWEFGAQEAGKRKRTAEIKMGRSKVLIISDIPPVLDKLRDVVRDIDVKPKQILIEARIIEVDKNYLEDIGFDWGTGSSGAESSTITTQKVSDSSKLGGHSLGQLVKPAGFNPVAGTSLSGVNPYNVGTQLLFQKLTGYQFEVMLHLLSENVHTNTLSAPNIMALNNQEASILVNTRYPIIKSEQTASTTGGQPTTSAELDYYQDIGIQLNVVPQVGADNSINMVVHPAVTSYTQTIAVGDTGNAYPIIQNREAETRVMMNDGETVVIGGLMKDVITKSILATPFLSKIPYVGELFKRETTSTEKVELLVFLTAHIVKDNEMSKDEATKIEERMLRRADAFREKAANEKNKNK